MFKNKCPSKPQFIYIKVGCKGLFISRTCLHDVTQNRPVLQGYKAVVQLQLIFENAGSFNEFNNALVT